MSDKRKRIGGNYTDYLVIAVVVGVLLMLGFCESAEASWGVEEQHDSNAGSTIFNDGYDRICVRYTYDAGTSAYGCPLVAVGGEEHSGFEFGIADELWPRWEGEIRLQQYDGFVDGGAALRRVVGDGPFQIGLGLSYWINKSPGSDSSVTFNLSLRYTWE